jgi:hypothetical protein
MSGSMLLAATGRPDGATAEQAVSAGRCLAP